MAGSPQRPAYTAGKKLTQHDRRTPNICSSCSGLQQSALLLLVWPASVTLFVGRRSGRRQ
eukprot:scaffold539369_cov17-Prasinocladus_malaysianus.AAC.1